MKLTNGFIFIVAVWLLSLSSMAFSLPVSGYTTQLKAVDTPVEKLNIHPPTAITIINATSNIIYAQVPYTDIDRVISPGGPNLHIYNYDPNVYSTQVVLLDPYRAAFTNNFYCPLAIVTVYGYPGNYAINYDDHLCRH